MGARGQHQAGDNGDIAGPEPGHGNRTVTREADRFIRFPRRRGDARPAVQGAACRNLWRLIFFSYLS
jgi:hypothetical protein